MSSSSFKAVLFDLDGTLLQVEMRSFIPRYVAGFHACCSERVSLEELQRVMRAGIHLLLETEGQGESNEDRLFAYISARLEIPEAFLRERFARYLASGFDTLAELVRPIPDAVSLIDICRTAEVPVVLATNPVFPQVLIEARCRWGGIDVTSFAGLTSFENSNYCKPQSGYFVEVAARLGVDPRDCLMVGNDTSHDLAATEVGMTTWLLDSYLLERDGPTWQPDYRGSHQQLLDFLGGSLPGPETSVLELVVFAKGEWK